MFALQQSLTRCTQLRQYLLMKKLRRARSRICTTYNRELYRSESGATAMELYAAALFVIVGMTPVVFAVVDALSSKS